MRWKATGEDPNMYRCCFCCHVRTGTIFLGLFHLMLNVFLLSCFAVMILHTKMDGDILSINAEPNQSNMGNSGNSMMNSDNSMMNSGNSMMNSGNDMMMDKMSSDDDMLPTNCYPFRKWTSEDKFVGLLLIMCSFFVTVMLVYGAAKGHAGYLMPFFCVQVFDFCVTCLTAVGYFSYGSSMHDMKKCMENGSMFNQQLSFPFENYLKSLDHDWVMLFAVVFFVLLLTLKAYFIGLVWACYKYLTTYRTSGNGARSYEASGGEDAEMLLPPKYEDAVRMAADEPPPPPYQPN